MLCEIGYTVAAEAATQGLNPTKRRRDGGYMTDFYYRAARKGSEFETRDIEPTLSDAAACPTPWSLQASSSDLRFLFSL